MNFDWLVNLDYGLPKEDIVIVLDIEPVISYKRGFDNGFVLDEFEKSRDFLEKARENYLDLAKRFNWTVIDSDSDVNSLLESITNILEIER
jgi:dTMP kinase